MNQSNVQARRPVREFFRRILRCFDDSPLAVCILTAVFFAIIVGVNLIPIPTLSNSAVIEEDTTASLLVDILAFVLVLSLITGAVAMMGSMSSSSCRDRASSSPTPRPSFQDEILSLLRGRRSEQ